MTRYVIVELARVVNIVVAEPEYAAQMGWKAAPLDVQVGDVDNGDGTFGRAPLDRPALGLRIDDAADQVQKPYTRFTVEYTNREAQAQAFKDGGYVGEAGPYVMDFATPAGMTPRAAADLILAQAAQLRGALDQLSSLRMQKYLVYRAANDADAQAAFDTVMAGIAAVGAALAGG